MADNATVAAEIQQTDTSLFLDIPMHFGEGVVVTLFRMWRGVALYHRNNEIVDRLVHDCLVAIHETFFSQDHLTLRIVRDACLCNDRRIRIATDTLTSYKTFVQTMRLHWIGRLDFTQDVTAEDLYRFAYIFESLTETDEHNADVLAQELMRYGITSIRACALSADEGERGHNDTETLKRQSKAVYFSTIRVAREMMDRAVKSSDLELRKIKRLMMTTVTLIMHEESSLLGLTSIKNFDDYTFSHSVNVAIYAVALGQRLGLPKTLLYELGICGLFHDVGKLDVPINILNKPGPLTPEEWTVIRTHPVHGAEVALRHRSWDDLSARIMAVTFEHHIKFDHTGYPNLTQPRKTALFSRIITIADCYDALSRPRVYRSTPYVSEKILGLMLAQGGKDFDPLLVKVFINMIGVYPLGALVLLDTNQIGLVTNIPSNADLVDRPHVTLLRRNGNTFVRADTINIADIDPDTGRFKWTILETLNPNDFDLSIEEFFL